MKIKVEKSRALIMLHEHKENHIKEYEKQMEGWKVAMEKWQEGIRNWKDSMSTDARSFDKQDAQRPNEPQKPRSYVSEYDKYIIMLEYHADDVIVLDEREFDQIIKDEFSWGQYFAANSMMYSNSIE
ncbi:MAG TPA: hypothetical protein VK190_02885 [Pseudoneobacillus sp.]|nr:hypothetical protein [Pseudoneobacillus sp.]